MKNPFNQDATQNNGYLYSTNASLSSQLANQRLTDVTLQAIQIQGKSVLDIGCGDGVYTLALEHYAKPKLIFAGDIAEQALRIAQRHAAGRNIGYMVNSAYALPFADQHFDVALLRGVLHHLDHPSQALGEALRVAKQIWVIEPNGYNPGLKVLERISRYHIEHGEKSYAPQQLEKWVNTHGGIITQRKWAGFVPMFCPDAVARLMKKLEPLVENIPGIREVGSAVYCFAAQGRKMGQE